MEEVITCLKVGLAGFISLRLILDGCGAFLNGLKRIFEVFGLRFGRHEARQ